MMIALYALSHGVTKLMKLKEESVVVAGRGVRRKGGRAPAEIVTVLDAGSFGTVRGTVDYVANVFFSHGIHVNEHFKCICAYK